MVVLDTNALLNLYRYDDAARDDLFKVMASLGERLFIPHQVMVEFWRNRENVLHDRLNTAQSAAERLEQFGEEAKKVLREWANRLAITDDARADVLSTVSRAFDEAISRVESSAGSAEEAEVRDTSQDPVLSRLGTILQGKVGLSPSSREVEEGVAEGLRRLAEKIPPGFKDEGKTDDQAIGDYLVWRQSLAELRTRETASLVFVTGDTSGDDWWRRERGELRGPRLELFAECRDEAEATLVLLRPQSLLFHAQRALDLQIEAETLRKVGEAEAVTKDEVREGWTATTAQAFLSRLRLEGPVQYDAFLEAVRSRGFVGRDRVYELGGYEPGRTLRGFTRPTRRIMQDMQDSGELSPSAAEPLETIYDPQFSFVQASGFQVPDELLAVLTQYSDESSPLDE
jgi:hypothetical protein